MNAGVVNVRRWPAFPIVRVLNVVSIRSAAQNVAPVQTGICVRKEPARKLHVFPTVHPWNAGLILFVGIPAGHARMDSHVKPVYVLTLLRTAT